MSDLTVAQLAAALTIDQARAALWVDPLNRTFARFTIDTAARQAGFLSQVGHESASLSVVVENLNYSASALVATFPKYFDATTAAAYNRQPEKIANRVYANRMGNGDEASGDGWKFRGRGLIQVTGLNNYTACGLVLTVDLTVAPEQLQSPEFAALSAGWFWQANGLNALADAKNVVGMTKRINGGTNGLADRQSRYDTASAALVG